MLTSQQVRLQLLPGCMHEWQRQGAAPQRRCAPGAEVMMAAVVQHTRREVSPISLAMPPVFEGQRPWAAQILGVSESL